MFDFKNPGYGITDTHVHPDTWRMMRAGFLYERLNDNENTAIFAGNFKHLLGVEI
ncbi:MAG: hypothetical protein IKA87_05885 [Lentisphaeria bacterium]|nr:hypothetical protein [Lentisphaeria bacterium]